MVHLKELIYDIYSISCHQYQGFLSNLLGVVLVVHLVATISDVALRSVVVVVGLNHAQGKIFTPFISIVDSLYVSTTICTRKRKILYGNIAFTGLISFYGGFTAVKDYQSINIKLILVTSYNTYKTNYSQTLSNILIVN